LSIYNWKLLELLTKEHYTKSRLAQLAIEVGALLLFAALILELQEVFASNHEYDGYQHVICSNGVWYPEGTDCKVALKNYYEEWGQIDRELKQEKINEEKYDKDEWVSGVTPDEWSDAEKYSDDSREQAHRYCAEEGYYDNNKKFCDKLAKGEDDTVFANEQGLKGKELEEEIAAQEDALCDNEDSDTTEIKKCMSDKREQQFENIEKTCD
jgi:hypothetical protein